METIRLIQKPENGRLIINVPEAEADEELIIEVRSARNQPPFNPGLAEASKAFFEKLNQIKTDFNEEDYNVYEQ
ncbi:hypothetical protein [Spirosoma luteum]|uniref:hypothetical protein n=1 Tax=Spirosoma luteum TaxID=431553 RepID=UPI00037557CE|nr:hypothetical protein [Spirosoma luteum]